MSDDRAMWRSAALAFLLLTCGGLATLQAQGTSRWGFNLEWEHDGASGTVFRLCVNGTCSPLAASRRGGNTWRAPLPMLPQGEHRLVVEACRGAQCVAGTPDLVVRVLPPSPRRPPIDVIEGPRIPVGDR